MVKLHWARNAEPDMKEYKVYACLTAGCTVQKSPTMLQATIPQPSVGTRPEWLLPQDTVGTVAVTAVDQSNNESGLSVSHPFDTVTPSAPTDLQFQ